MKSRNISERERKRRVDELRSLVEVTGLPRSELCIQLDVSKRTLEYWLTEQQPVPQMGLLAMRWISRQQ